MRNNFDKQLDNLNTELITMGALCEEAIVAAVNTLTDDDRVYFAKATSAEVEIDNKEREIETLCMKLLLHQQPVARDLRTISSALKMISDMERIGDQASDIADIAQHLAKDYTEIHTVHISKMAKDVIKMVTDSVESFVKKDLELARSVMVYDDVVDNLFIKVKEELTKSIKDGSYTSAHSALDVLMIAKYFERIGDHAVNIAEWVEYAITGIRVHDEDINENS